MDTRSQSRTEHVRRKLLQRTTWAVRRATAAQRVLPDFLILGAMRSGTTSFYDYVCQHPRVPPAFKKEIRFFDRHLAEGLDWYRAHFPLARHLLGRERQMGGRALTGEATPYYLFHPDVPRRVQEHLPQARFLVLLRNPVDRAYSHHAHQLARGRETLPFGEACAREEERLRGETERLAADPHYRSERHRRQSYLSRGRYAEQLERWFARFPRERFLILQSEWFFREPQAAMDLTCRFLELPEFVVTPHPATNAQKYPRLDADLRRELEEYYAPHNARLRTLLGREFDW